MCKKKFQSPWVCRNERSNPRCVTVSTEPRLQTTVRELESFIRHTQGWLKLIVPPFCQFTSVYPTMLQVCN